MGEAIRKRAVGFCLVLALISGAPMVRVSGPEQEVSAQLKPPEGQALAAEAHAKGFQLYTCKNDGNAYNWTLKGPDAELFDKAGKAVGRHFAGPRGNGTTIAK
jgi:Protein of unknown function (DUF3455)